MKQILPHLYLGSLEDASNVSSLMSEDISLILTVDSEKLKEDIPGVKHKFVFALDVPDFDLLTKFDECVMFVSEALNKNSNILVHCHQGQSRSTSVVMAYLMRRNKQNLKDVWQHLKEKGATVRPNEGFIHQLTLWQKMKCRIDPTNLAYRMYRMNMLEDAVRNEENVVLGADPVGAPANERVYKCRKCRRAVFRASSVYPHMKGSGTFSWQTVAEADIDDSELCRDSLFIEPVKWMEEEIKQMDGKLMCPKCSAKLGSFTWIGERCSCSRWVTPAFHFLNGKVDLCGAVTINAAKPIDS